MKRTATWKLIAQLILGLYMVIFTVVGASSNYQLHANSPVSRGWVSLVYSASVIFCGLYLAVGSWQQLRQRR